VKATATPPGFDGGTFLTRLDGLGIAHEGEVQADGDGLFVPGVPEDREADAQAVLDAWEPVVHVDADPDDDLAAAINAVDTSNVTDAATKAALNALKSALLGSGKPAAVSGRPTDR
jgi:hypothetical protein